MRLAEFKFGCIIAVACLAMAFVACSDDKSVAGIEIINKLSILLRYIKEI